MGGSKHGAPAADAAGRRAARRARARTSMEGVGCAHRPRRTCSDGGFRRRRAVLVDRGWGLRGRHRRGAHRCVDAAKDAREHGPPNSLECSATDRTPASRPTGHLRISDGRLRCCVCREERIRTVVLRVAGRLCRRCRGAPGGAGMAQPPSPQKHAHPLTIRVRCEARRRLPDGTAHTTGRDSHHVPVKSDRPSPMKR